MASILHFFVTLFTIYFALRIIRWFVATVLINTTNTHKNKNTFNSDVNQPYNNIEKDISSEVKIIEDSTNGNKDDN